MITRILNLNRIIKISSILFVFSFISFICLLSINQAKAEVVIESLPDNKVFNDFVISPGKMEMELSPGEKGTFELQISNRLGTEKTFSISEEDFVGSNNPVETIVLLGDDRGPYSLKDYVTISTSTINIEHGKRVRIPISVSIPKNAEPGGLYGSVIVGILSKNNVVGNNGVVSSNPVITRIGALIFVRIKGEINESGKLFDFKLAGNKNIIFNSDDIRFNIFFQNDGNVHLSPKGKIEVKNILGTTIDTIEIEPWFAMPKSLRFREVKWNPAFLFGKYTASVSVDRGYDNVIDQSSFDFFVIPWEVVLSVFIVLIIFVIAVRKIFRKIKSIVAIILLGMIYFLPLSYTNAQQVMSSTNYKLQSDSINFAGGRSSSASYIIEDTVGEVASGVSSSANFSLNAGYQQNSTVTISVTPASNVTMSPSIGGLTGGIADGQTSFTVTTDNPAGYTTTVSAQNSPALKTASDSFNDYVPAGSDPDYTFTFGSAESVFAFTPEGDDIAVRYKNSGSTCGIGSSDTSNACWDGLSIAGKTILNRTSSNQPSGTTSTIKFRAASGSSHVQEDGVYVATTTITVLSL